MCGRPVKAPLHAPARSAIRDGLRFRRAWRRLGRSWRARLTSGVAVVLALPVLLDLFLQPVLQVLRRALELVDPLTEGLADLGQPARTERRSARSRRSPAVPEIQSNPSGRLLAALRLQGPFRLRRPARPCRHRTVRSASSPSTTRLMLHSDEPIAMAMTLMPSAPSAPKTRPAIAGRLLDCRRRRP